MRVWYSAAVRSTERRPALTAGTVVLPMPATASGWFCMRGALLNSVSRLVRNERSSFLAVGIVGAETEVEIFAPRKGFRVERHIASMGILASVDTERAQVDTHGIPDSLLSG